MRHNMGKNERIFRIMLGVAVILAGIFILGEVAGLAFLPVLLLFIGIALVLTGIFAFCPLNDALNFNTCSECHKGGPHQHLPV